MVIVGALSIRVDLMSLAEHGVDFLSEEFRVFFVFDGGRSELGAFLQCGINAEELIRSASVSALTGTDAFLVFMLASNMY